MMVKNRAAKQAVRNRMAETDEPYSVARRVVSQPVPDKWGWVRGEVQFASKVALSGSFPLNHQYAYWVDGEDSAPTFPYGWHPSLGFFYADNNGELVEITLTQPSSYDGTREYSAPTAYLIGRDLPLSYQDVAPVQVDSYVEYAMLDLVSVAWEGNLHRIALLGYAMWSLGDTYWIQEGHIAEWICKWFLDHGVVDAALTNDALALLKNIKDETEFPDDGFKVLMPSWLFMEQSTRNQFVDELTGYLNSGQVALEALSDEGVVYRNRATRPPVTPLTLHQGDKVKLAGIGPLMDVLAFNDNYAVLTFLWGKKKQHRYTIIDWRGGIAGPHNSYGHGVESVQDAEVVIEALEQKRIEVSVRNNITLKIQKVVRKS
jgi:hypothetical protein